MKFDIKNFALILFFFMFLVGTASAFEFDNVKSYDAEAKIITLKNMYGLGSDLAEYKLTYNTDNCLYDCYAEGTLKLYNVDEKLFQDMKFEGGNVNSYKIKIADKLEMYYEDENTYERVCDKIAYQGNLSIEYQDKCYDKLISTNKVEKTRPIYRDYNGENLDAGTYYWKIKGTKNAWESVDWIGTAQGLDMNEWAWWVGVQPSVYYKFNNATDGYNGFKDSSGNNLSLNNTGCGGLCANTQVSGVSAGLGEAIQLASNNNALRNPFSAVNYQLPNAQFTVCYWIKYSSGLDRLGGIETSGWYYGLEHSGNVANDQEGQTAFHPNPADVNIGTFYSKLQVNDGNWKRICWVREGTGTNQFKCYMNGVNTQNGTNNYNATTMNGFNLGTGSGAETYDDYVIYNNYAFTTADITYDYNSGNGLELDYAPPVIDIAVTTTLKNPTDSFNTSATTIYFQANYSVAYGNMTNATVYVWNNAGSVFGKSSATVTGTYNSTNLSITSLTDGNYTWNSLGCAVNSTGSKCSFASSNRTFKVDTTAPTISITNPIANSVILNQPSIYLNFTLADAIGISGCKYSLDGGANKSLGICAGNSSLSYFDLFNLTTNQLHSIIFYANDTFNTMGSASVSFYSHNFTHTGSQTTAGEGDNVQFYLYLYGSGISTSYANTNATFIYQGTQYAPTTSDFTNANYILFGKSLAMLSGSGNSSGKNTQYNWTYNVKSGTPALYTGSTDTKNLTVYSVSIDDCNVLNGRVIWNVTLKDEELNTVVIANTTYPSNIEIEAIISSWTNSSQTWEYHNQWANNQSVAICVPNGLLNYSSYRIDIIAGYEDSTHVREFFYLDNGTLDNSSMFNGHTNRTTSLMDLLTTDSTTFLFEWTDENGLIRENVIVHTFRKYIGEGLFREVERSKQDDNGQTHVHLVEEDVIYYFMITENGQILYTSNTYNAKCLSTPCQISLSASASETNWGVIDSEGGGYSIATNKDARTTTTYFSLGEVGLVNVSLYEYIGGTPTLINSSSTTATSGSITLSVPHTYGNQTFFVAIFRDNQFVKSGWIDMKETAFDYFGTTGVILAGFMVMSLMLMGVSEGVAFIVIICFSVVIVVIMGLMDMEWSAIISLCCAGGIIILKLVQRRRGA